MSFNNHKFCNILDFRNDRHAGLDVNVNVDGALRDHDSTNHGVLKESRRLRQTCTDDHSFIDVMEYSCLDWTGYSCDSYEGYLAEDMESVREHCPLTCGDCPATADGQDCDPAREGTSFLQIS